MSGYPVTLPLSGRVGQTIDLTLLWKEGGITKSLSGWTALIQVRKDSSSPVLCELSSGDGEIILGGSPHNIVAHFTEAHTESVGEGKFKWDLRLANFSETEVVYPVEGTFTLKLPISRPAV